MAAERDRIPTFPGTSKQIVLPDLGAPTADTHAHLDMLADPVGTLARAAQAGVMLIASVVDLTEEPEFTLDGLERWLSEAASQVGVAAPEVVLIAGIHPHSARLWSDENAMRLRELARDDRVRCVGEVGLDFHYDHSPRDDQRRMFREQLQVAHESGLPVAVHLRDAHDEGLSILAEIGVPTAGAIIHCFTEGPETAERFMALDDAVRISFAGPVTFAKAEQVREAVRIVPLDRLLIETDCPFLAPAPYRGAPNEPAYVTLNAAVVAEARGESTAEIAAACLSNARTLFALEADR
jgi:TatD DNase family protein